MRQGQDGHFSAMHFLTSSGEPPHTIEAVRSDDLRRRHAPMPHRLDFAARHLARIATVHEAVIADLRPERSDDISHGVPAGLAVLGAGGGVDLGFKPAGMAGWLFGKSGGQ